MVAQATRNGKPGKGAGSTPPPIDNGRRGDVVFISCVDGLAEQMQRVGLRAIQGSAPGVDQRAFADLRQVIILHRNDPMFASQMAGMLERGCHPEQTATLDVDQLGFPFEPDAFVAWWDDALGMGRFEDRFDFYAVADRKASRRSPPSRDGQKAAPEPADEYAALSDADLGIIAADELEPEAVDWLQPDRLAVGKIHLLAGEGGNGKSQLSIAIVSALTNGKFPDGTTTTPGTCLILAAEDGQRDVIIPRLIAANADRGRVKFLTARARLQTKDGSSVIAFKSFQDLDYWAQIFRRFPDTRLLVADPLPAFLGRGVNDHRNAEVMSVLEPFAQLLEEHKVALLGITHLGKSVDVRSPEHKILGSVAYTNVARIVYLVGRDPQDRDRRVLAMVKNNIRPMQPPIAFRIVEATVGPDDRPIRTSRIEFDSAPVDVSTEEIFEPKRLPRRRGPAPRKTQEVAVWLLSFLQAEGQPVPLRRVFDAAGEKGYVGEFKADSKGKMRWSIPGILYQAKDMVPKLSDPHDGWTIDDIRDGASVAWQAVREGDPGESPY